ncbi:hypothetical protein TraAM80_03853 [Trypanosoma rangeli]|uniref:Uncharacterized protein n=1 Tax=Trypanosoma rangeli TaxID=5698 RepID=A0A422NMF9_TRYRA|nr:uncharacterized protein TraAM80_03853 [Trypanosoma rangeli]RNF06584.1 hypothetical protein TraAM80_03853 [Trypanosoma rangeli]|eukprot:RNF06584.1 hypothetical protein TraAM80_03853 [Trypanosoma rangeli]
MRPDTFDTLANTVESYATQGACERGYRIDAKELDVSPNRLSGFPFATKEAVGVHLMCSKGDFTVSADVSSNPKATWWDLVPSVSWTKSVRGQQHEFLLRLATTPLVYYALHHPQFTCSSEMKFMDGFRSHFTASTRLSEKSQFGASVEYDPSRSGLIDYTVALSRTGCSAVWRGDFVVQYNATRGAAVHTRIPVHRMVSAVTLVERQRVIVGAEARSPCGAQMLMNVNLVDSRVMLAVIRNLDDIWKITMNYSAPLPGSSSGSARFGVVFTSQYA